MVLVIMSSLFTSFIALIATVVAFILIPLPYTIKNLNCTPRMGGKLVSCFFFLRYFVVLFLSFLTLDGWVSTQRIQLFINAY